MRESEPASYAEEDAAKAAAVEVAARMIVRGAAAAADAEVEDEGAEISADEDRSRRTCESNESTTLLKRLCSVSADQDENERCAFDHDVKSSRRVRRLAGCHRTLSSAPSS
jgi:hypothetical protein